ncbi:MAG TPA: rhodanese-like domain-containing protein [Candidatus Binatia bacterium]|jgi:rhodanese-related sulfurtransferase|nr:rhodanese-like domain-containing protein [Candidatus Binatia bacterium]
MSTTGEQSVDRNQLGLRMAAVAGAALVVGLAFNSANPLGVRATLSASPKPAFGSRADPARPAAPAGPKSVYENETVSLSVETEAAPSPATAALAPAPAVPSLTWPETSKLLSAGQIVLVDARAAVYYQTEHVPGAVSLPAGSPPADLSAFAAKYPRNTALVVYCGSLKCPLSHQLVAVLTGQLGYTNVREIPGGFAEYRQFEAQVAKGSAP